MAKLKLSETTNMNIPKNNKTALSKSFLVTSKVNRSEFFHFSNKTLVTTSSDHSKKESARSLLTVFEPSFFSKNGGTVRERESVFVCERERERESE